MRSARDLSKPRIGNIDLYWPPGRKSPADANAILARPIVRVARNRSRRHRRLVVETAADELMVVSDAQAARLRSFELIGQARQKPSP